ncbi:MAG TPA: cytidylate kinase-like family protein [Mycobacteriales bacterium]|jgi:Cytidylate kinase
MGVVTISATYGAGGSEIGPAVAAMLGLPFVDRAIPAGVARRLGVPLSDAEQKDETYDTGLWRIVSSMALVPDLAGAGPLAYSTLADDRAFREKTEQVLREIAGSTGGVILGRAGALVLGDVPGALHVRLDGPEGARTATARRLTGRDEQTCREALRGNDAARTAYWRHFYRCDPTEPRHYHLVIDSTTFPFDTVADLIVAAAHARGIGH